MGAGEVIATSPAEGHPLATGEAVNVAKRLEELAGEGEILIDEETHGLVQGCVQTEHAEHQPARSGETIAARRLVRVDPHTTRRVSPLDSPSSAATGNSRPSWPNLRPLSATGRAI